MSHFTLKKCLSYFLARYAIPYKHISCLNLMVTQYQEVVISCYLVPLKKGPGWWEFLSQNIKERFLYVRLVFKFASLLFSIPLRIEVFRQPLKVWVLIKINLLLKMLASRPRYQVIQKSCLWLDSILARFKRIQDRES